MLYATSRTVLFSSHFAYIAKTFSFAYYGILVGLSQVGVCLSVCLSACLSV